MYILEAAALIPAPASLPLAVNLSLLVLQLTFYFYHSALRVNGDLVLCGGDDAIHSEHFAVEFAFYHPRKPLKSGLIS